MNKTTKIFLKIATALVLLGSILFVIIGFAIGWDFTKFDTNSYQTKTYDIEEDFSDITINAQIADVDFAISNNEKCKVVCHEQENMQYSVFTQDNVLTVSEVDTKKWYQYVGINIRTPKITIYLPQTQYSSLTIKSDTSDIVIPREFTFNTIDISLSTGDVTCYASANEDINIKVSTGDVFVKDVSTTSLTVSVSTGETDLVNIACKNVVSNGTTGDISLENVVASGKISIERSTGDVEFENSDGMEIFVKTSTGEVSGSLRSQKKFVVQSSTGEIEVPQTDTGGKCEIITSTGDIEIRITE